VGAAQGPGRPLILIFAITGSKVFLPRLDPWTQVQTLTRTLSPLNAYSLIIERQPRRKIRRPRSAGNRVLDRIALWNWAAGAELDQIKS
jgi:hypothetical protein